MIEAEPPREIDLVREAPFDLGGLQVRPAALELDGPGGVHPLERRVMQVLVALARRRGEVVSRDELNAVCWGGRIVGDDAINRCVSVLRRLSEATGAFEIDTVPRVGFRLRAGTAAAVAAPRPRRLRLWIGLGLMAALVLVAAALAVLRPMLQRAPQVPRVAVTGFEPLAADPASRAFAVRLTDNVSGVVSENAVGMTVAGAGERGEPPDMTLGGTLTPEGDGWRVRVYLTDQASGARLWSREFRRPTSETEMLSDEVAVAATEATFDAVAPLAEDGLRLSPRSLALFIKAREAHQNRLVDNHGDARRYFEQLVAREPQFVNARAVLALTYVADSADAPPPEREALRRRGREEAERAIRMNPAAAGAAYDALSRLEGGATGAALLKSETIRLEGLSKRPDYPFLNMRECQFLMAVGRAANAYSYCERALALRPLAPQIGHSYVRALYGVGAIERAHNAIQKFARFHPRHVPTRDIRLDLAVFGGYEDEARAILQDPELRPVEVAEEGVPAMLLLLTARRTRTPGDIDRALSALEAGARRGILSSRYYVVAAADLGRPDRAFAALESPLADDSSYYLLTPPASSLWRDPRFWRIAQRIGYVDYWRRTGHWPDFCADATIPFDCRKAAEAVGG